MPRLIAFILCLAVLAAGASVRTAMALAALAFAATAAYLAWGFARLFIGPR